MRMSADPSPFPAPRTNWQGVSATKRTPATKSSPDNLAQETHWQTILWTQDVLSQKTKDI